MDLGEQPEEHEERREHMPLRNPVGSGIDLLADVAQRECVAPSFLQRPSISSADLHTCCLLHPIYPVVHMVSCPSA